MVLAEFNDLETGHLSCSTVKLGYGDRVVADQLDVQLRASEFAIIIGPNGCGKSTFLKALGRILRPIEGLVVLDGRDIHTMSTRDVARRLGILPQHPDAPEGMTVAELVAQGRYPQRPLLKGWREDDQEAVDTALAVTEILDLADRQLAELSGGQRQRAWLAMVLAQQTGIVLLDEPTTYLDIRHQFEIMELLKKLNTEDQTTIVAIMHDLSQAITFATRLIVMHDGKIVGDGPPEDVFTPECASRVFGITGDMSRDASGRLRGFLPTGKAPQSGNAP